MLVYKKGDVLNSGETLIVHGCNCFNTMGAGIARQVRRQYSEAYLADQATRKGDKTKLGNFSYAENENGVIIVNAYIQYGYSHNKVDLRYDALKEAMTKICIAFSNKIIAMPKIGAGLAGGDWFVIEKILEDISERWKKVFHIYEL